MTFMNGISQEEFNELIESFRHRFHYREITEQEFRAKLAKYGFNATEIEQEVELNAPKMG